MISEPKRTSPSKADIQQPRLLYSREQTRAALGGVSRMMLWRLEQRGALTAVRLTGGRNARVFYRAAQVQTLAGRDPD